jgi:hypothetical protein
MSVSTYLLFHALKFSKFHHGKGFMNMYFNKTNLTRSGLFCKNEKDISEILSILEKILPQYIYCMNIY